MTSYDTDIQTINTSIKLQRTHLHLYYKKSQTSHDISLNLKTVQKWILSIQIKFTFQYVNVLAVYQKHNVSPIYLVIYYIKGN